jgi:hypothetical protein
VRRETRALLLVADGRLPRRSWCSGRRPLPPSAGRPRVLRHGRRGRPARYEQGHKILGGAGNDRLFGGTRKDVLRGEGGNDTIRADDGVLDVVDGGAGTDTARVDRGRDQVSAATETVLG